VTSSVNNILLIGQPNTGKSTLFNWLTGRNQKVVNYPGSTVDYSVGGLLPRWAQDWRVFDSPGTYSVS